MEESELRDLVESFAETLMGGLGRNSRWVLKTALDAARTDGIGVQVKLKIPQKKNDYLDLEITEVNSS